MIKMDEQEAAQALTDSLAVGHAMRSADPAALRRGLDCALEVIALYHAAVRDGEPVPTDGILGEIARNPYRTILAEMRRGDG